MKHQQLFKSEIRITEIHAQANENNKYNTI